jgi:hypothetical protein
VTHTITERARNVTWHHLGGGFLIRESLMPDGAPHVVAVGDLHPAVTCADVGAVRALVEGWRG